jgi:peptidoglycan-associated lipoprotein
LRIDWREYRHGSNQHQDDAAQPGITAQPGSGSQYSYAYGQAPSGYDAYDTRGGAVAGGGRARAARQWPARPATRFRRIALCTLISIAPIFARKPAIIESNARTLAGNRRIITQLEGHTDERGSREYNIALGERRANAVRQIMIAMGVSPQQVRVVSYGEERPAATGQDEQSYALNRRVEIVY